MASTEETAIGEVRPWIGSYVSVAQFQLLRSLRVVDCSVLRESSYPIYFENPLPAEREKAVWTYISRAFAEPILSTDDSAGYVPTQILAELFRNFKYDGLVYRSNFGENGYNIAIFNMNDAKLINCGVREIKCIQIKFEDVGDRYFIK
jgi:hypothetical protein